ncbi:hypothetical protein BDV96DRAFT_489214 [Lophiotrema nucula]|uniref:Uncharacterized protein n=1 Tax=Lophiotrema nucula TaxID=690887 RepID=A0A6A5ZHL8_9PLEO|nr:hypothetical protein BDV96DRAFT_489214 [Lophiotrema nucula]
MAPYTIDEISIGPFNTVLSRYSSTVPDKLGLLDTERYETIPAAVESRKERDEDTLLQKSEVETLVEWKLKHGTFRPKLLDLVKSNPEPFVQETISNAFTSLNAEDPLPALKVLTQLKGIGPATASLLLSVYAPGEVPFFSDELFRWCMWDEDGKPDGWKRAIKYNIKEYGALIARVQGLRKRLRVSAVDAERVAYVLGKEGVDVKDVRDEDEAVEEAAEEEEKESRKPIQKVVKRDDVKKSAHTGVKRKVAEVKPVTEGTRRSSRRRTEE